MSRNHRFFTPILHRIILVGALFGGLASTGCIFVGDSDARDEAEEARESAHDVAEALAHGLTEAAEGIADAVSQIAEEMDAESRVENPIGFRELYDFLPERIGDLRRVSREGGTGGAFGFEASHAEAEYEADGGVAVDVSIVDVGALPVVGSDGFLEELDLKVDEESDRGWARSLEYKGYPAVEEFERTDGDRGKGEFIWFIEGRFVVVVEGRDITADELHEVRDAIGTDDLARLRDTEGT